MNEAETSPETLSQPSEGAQPEVTVVIVNWNGRDLLRNCLRSIDEQTKSSHEVIVIDNASADGSAEMVASEFPQVVLIANPDNRGFAAANNQGIEIAKGRNILLLNPDTLVLEGAVDKSLAWLKEHPDVGCMGCQVFHDEAKTIMQRTCFADMTPWTLFLVESGLSNKFPRSKILGKPTYGWWDRDGERDVDVVTGCYMLAPREVVEKVGALDDAFFIYAEEADWCLRIRKAGYRCVYAPVAPIVHLDGGKKSTSQVKSRMHVQLQKSKLIYFRKHYSAFSTFLAKSIFVGSALARLAIFAPMGALTGSAEAKARSRLAKASLGYLLLGLTPTN